IGINKSCLCQIIMITIFFFQAEDGIRGFHVTGVQTCALPITLNGESGAGNSLCAQEVQYDGNTSFSVAQISATSHLAGTDYLSYRLFTGTTRTLRGMAYVDSQNRSVPYGGTFITITRLGGIA